MEPPFHTCRTLAWLFVISSFIRMVFLIQDRMLQHNLFFFIYCIVYIFLVTNSKNVKGPLGPQIWGSLQLLMCWFLNVVKGVILWSKGCVHADTAIAFRSTRQKSHYKIFVHSGVFLVICFSNGLLSLWAFCRFCYIFLRLFLHLESLFIRDAGRRHIFITTYRLLTPLSYCFLFLI